MPDYTIGQLAKSVGIPISTIRFYERTGLFKPDARSGANYRQYSEKALERLRFIRAAQATGFSLEDIREFLRLTHSDEAPCQEVVALTKNRLREIRKKLSELRHVERVLTKSLDDCCRGIGPDLCGEILKLKGQTVPCCDDPKNCPQCA